MHPPDKTVAFTINGRSMERRVPTQRMLVDLLREDCSLTGTKISCDQNACGACTVHVDGQPYAACSTFVFEVEGANVTTIEGLAQGDKVFQVLQDAFAEVGAFQCGFCTSGMLMLATALLREGPLDRHAIGQALAGNWCRCTGYGVVIDAVHIASRRLHPETRA